MLSTDTFTSLQSTGIHFETRSEERKRFCTVKGWIFFFFFFAGIYKEHSARNPSGKNEFTHSKSNTTTDFTRSHFWLPTRLSILLRGAHLTTFKAKQCNDFTVGSMPLRKDVRTLEDTTNTASRPVTQCRWPGSACTQPWNNNCCLVFDVSLGSGRRSCSGEAGVCWKKKKKIQWGHGLK